MTDICLITGNHPRHKHFATQLILSGKIGSWVIEERESFASTPGNISEDLKSLFRRTSMSERELKWRSLVRQ